MVRFRLYLVCLSRLIVDAPPLGKAENISFIWNGSGGGFLGPSGLLWSFRLLLCMLARPAQIMDLRSLV